MHKKLFGEKKYQYMIKLSQQIRNGKQLSKSNKQHILKAYN